MRAFLTWNASFRILLDFRLWMAQLATRTHLDNKMDFLFFQIHFSVQRVCRQKVTRIQNDSCTTHKI